MILEEFDPARRAIINPEDVHTPLSNFPETAVSCFSRETFARLCEQFEVKELVSLPMANIATPVYEIHFEGERFAIFNAPVGAPACVSIIEDMIALGMKRLVLFGTCGIFDDAIRDTSIIIPTSAIRDEGTSYHYAPPSREIVLNALVQEQLADFLTQVGVSYHRGKVWTTDGIYRETVEKLRKRKEEGAICVDMECSAVAALAAFRQIKVCHFFYAADHVAEEKWDQRSLANSANLEEKDKVASLALAFALAFHQKENHDKNSN